MVEVLYLSTHENSRFELNLASTDGNVLRYLVPVLPHVLTDHCVLRVQDGCTISVLPLKTREKKLNLAQLAQLLGQVCIFYLVLLYSGH